MDASPNASSPPVCVTGPLPEKSVYDLKIDLPPRMKSGLLGSRPSAIQATVTPAPVMPRACACSAWVVVRSSGSSGFDGVPHTPRTALPPGLAGPPGPPGAAGTWLAVGGATVTFWSGTTDATAGLFASVAASAGVTVAANDDTELYPIRLVPPAAFTCEITGDSADAGLADWSLSTTMTGDAPCAAVPAAPGGDVAALAVAARARAHRIDTTADRPMTCWGFLMVPSTKQARRERNQQNSTEATGKIQEPTLT